MSTLDNEDIERIAAVIEARMHHDVTVVERRTQFLRHLPRRCIILAVVLAGGIVLQIAIETTGIRHVTQSAELGLAALFEAAFTRIKESA